MFVVVATHNDEFQTVLRRILKANGHVVFLVTNWSELREAMRSEPGLYIMDNFGPQDMGLNEARKLHASHHQVLWVDGHTSAPAGIPRLHDWKQLENLPAA